MNFDFKEIAITLVVVLVALVIDRKLVKPMLDSKAESTEAIA